ncbi:hypothetical protein [Pedococcus sp. P5_B7]
MRAQWGKGMPWLVTGLMLVAMATVLSGRDAGWVGDPLWGQETIGVAQVLVLPLLTGGAAVVGWRDVGGILTLIPAGRQRWRHFCATFAAWAVPVVALYAVGNLFVVLTSRWSEPSIPNATPWPALTQTGGALLVFVVGYALGVVLRSWLGSVVAALLTVAVLILDRMGVIVTGLAEYTSSGTMLGTVANPAYFAKRLVWMVLVGAPIIALLVTDRRRRAGLLTAVALALVVGALVFETDDSYRVVPGRTDICTSTPVVVCAPPEFRARAERAAQMAGETGAVLRELGVRSPSRFVMWQPGRDHMDFLMLISDKLRSPLVLGDVLGEVVAPKSCRLWSGPEPPPYSWFYSEALVESYVMTEITGKTAEPYGRLLTSKGAEESRALVTQAATALQECDLSKVPPSFSNQ